MIVLAWILGSIVVISLLAYQRASLAVFSISLLMYMLFVTRFQGLTTGVLISWIIFALLVTVFNVKWLRRQLITKHIFKLYQRLMPTMSRTEREAISAGTVTWEGDLFCGNPNWQTMFSLPKATLTEEEQAFLDGPVETLCEMVDDWRVTHIDGDLSEEVWQFLKDKGFFALIIPKEYGGKEFSAYAHSQILTKVSGRSITLSTTIAVPNSLGPAELILHYGTNDQKKYYLPRLARGEEIPCFALTSPDAGSDAGSMTDYGIVCYQDFQGQKTLGVKLNWNKRYITLAPVATVVGLAFKLYDPDHLLGTKEDIGITCALIPRNTPGITIGRRHFPLNSVFQNGPIQGKDVFIPLDWIIGGAKKAGKGWGMLMECLAAGRAISLPASALGGAKVLVYATGAYARIRKQFNLPIGRFEGIEEPLARIAVYTYIMDAARTFAAATIDTGEKPSVASAIVKYHVTEMGRKIAIDGMDIHGGKGICLGPNNYLGRGYEAAPIAITVEGANILTRNLIIFGQGAIRCHPYVLAELEAAKSKDETIGLLNFDKAVTKHMGFAISNVFRTLLLGLTNARLVRAPAGKTKRYLQLATRFSAALAMTADMSMLALGSDLKRKESISARLGDILSYLYLLSAVIKHYNDQGEPADDLPIIRVACETCLYEIQERFAELIRNYPSRFFAFLIKWLVFPAGQQLQRPRDRLNHKIAQLLMAPTETRARLSAGAFLATVPGNVMADLEDALLKTIESEAVEKLIKNAKREEVISGYTLLEQAQAALDKSIISKEQYDLFIQAYLARQKVIAVDDFAMHELAQSLVNSTNYDFEESAIRVHNAG